MAKRADHHMSKRFMFSAAHYKVWFEWLRDNKAYRDICEGRGGSSIMQQIHRDWGDIRKARFSTWFALKGRQLFAEPVAVDSVRLLQQGQRVDNGYFAIAVHNDMQWKIAKHRVLRALKQNIERKPMFLSTKSQAAYPSTRKVNIAYARRALKVWTLLRDHPDWTLYEIADAAGISGEKHTQTAQVVNIRRRATNIMQAVERGQFPIVATQRTRKRRS